MKGNSSNSSAPGESAGVTQKALTPGVWGGQHISMEITESGATISYDCAHGSITERIVPDGNSKFVVKGLHVKEHPGPTREEDETEGQRATYTGSIEGDTMTLSVSLSQPNETIGDYTLVRGRLGRVRKCA